MLYQSAPNVLAPARYHPAQQAKRGFYLAVMTTVLALVVVGLGAYTRLMHAGLGCPDWPGCYGFLTVPDTASALAIAAQRFPDAPVMVEKGWVEMLHRYVAGALMLGVLILTLRMLQQRHQPRYPWRLTVGILALIIVQALFGLWTVTLKLWPQVVTVHLLGGFATFSLLYWLTWQLAGIDWQPLPATQQRHRLRQLTLLALSMVIIQIVLGGWTSANYAALACPDLPTCQGQWWPTMDFQQGFNIMQAIGPNYLGGQLAASARTAIHMSHRLGAIAVTIALIPLLVLAWRYSRGLSSGQRAGVQQLTLLVLLAFVVQLTLGISNVVWHLPLTVAVAHNLGGAFLLSSLVVLTGRLYR